MQFYSNRISSRYNPIGNLEFQSKSQNKPKLLTWMQSLNCEFQNIQICSTVYLVRWIDRCILLSGYGKIKTLAKSLLRSFAVDYNTSMLVKWVLIMIVESQLLIANYIILDYIARRLAQPCSISLISSFYN